MEAVVVVVGASEDPLGSGADDADDPSAESSVEGCAGVDSPLHANRRAATAAGMVRIGMVQLSTGRSAVAVPMRAARPLRGRALARRALVSSLVMDATCSEDHTGEVPKHVLDALPYSQRGETRHRCAACAYLAGIAEGRRQAMEEIERGERRAR